MKLLLTFGTLLLLTQGTPLEQDLFVTKAAAKHFFKEYFQDLSSCSAAVLRPRYSPDLTVYLGAESFGLERLTQLNNGLCSSFNGTIGYQPGTLSRQDRRTFALVVKIFRSGKQVSTITNSYSLRGSKNGLQIRHLVDALRESDLVPEKAEACS